MQGHLLAFCKARARASEQNKMAGPSVQVSNVSSCDSEWTKTFLIWFISFGIQLMQRHLLAFCKVAK